ncbi:MAG: hypothetical protein AAFP04_06505 [Myxococcota bacterium]
MKVENPNAPAPSNEAQSTTERPAENPASNPTTDQGPVDAVEVATERVEFARLTKAGETGGRQSMQQAMSMCEFSETGRQVRCPNLHEGVA